MSLDRVRLIAMPLLFPRARRSDVQACHRGPVDDGKIGDAIAERTESKCPVSRIRCLPANSFSTQHLHYNAFTIPSRWRSAYVRIQGLPKTWTHDKTIRPQ